MRLQSKPVTCQWTAEQLNDKTISFVPNQNGIGNRITGQILAVEVAEGLYIQVALVRPHSHPILYWLNQEEAQRIQKSQDKGGIDFILA